MEKNSRASKSSNSDSAQIYVAHPYSAWERDTNENTNRLLRQYAPMETDITTVKPATLNAIAERLNNRPGKTLNYRTPHEVLQEAMVALDG